MIVAVIDGVCGGASVLFGTAHIVAIVGRAVGGDFTYDFRFYSLCVLGLLLVVPGLLCARHVRGLARGTRAAWNAALWSSVVLLAVTGPLVPLQNFAIPLAALSLANIAALVLTRSAHG